MEETANSPTPDRYKGLVPWKPGQSGNPGGRPKQEQALIQELMEKTDNLKAVADQLVFMIAQEYDLKTKHAACRTILEYCIGRPKQSLEVTGNISLEQIIAGSYIEHQDRLKQGA
jgi:hypothetical protein